MPVINTLAIYHKLNSSATQGVDSNVAEKNRI